MKITVSKKDVVEIRYTGNVLLLAVTDSVAHPGKLEIEFAHNVNIRVNGVKVYDDGAGA